MDIHFFSNGNTMVFEGGEQVPELQMSWLAMYIKFLKSKDINPESVSLTMPDGRKATYIEKYESWTIE